MKKHFLSITAGIFYVVLIALGVYLGRVTNLIFVALILGLLLGLSQGGIVFMISRQFIVSLIFGLGSISALVWGLSSAINFRDNIILAPALTILAVLSMEMVKVVLSLYFFRKKEKGGEKC